jgi:methionyl aminopeptidase
MVAIRSRREIDLIREASCIAAEAARILEGALRAGISTGELEELAIAFIEEKGATSAFKGYKGFPGSICVSVNEEVVHGIPGPRRLKEGDIVSIDVGVKKAGFYGDIAVTCPVGSIGMEVKRLLETTKKALYAGIGKAVAGGYLSDISHAIQSESEKNGFSVVRDLVGHGIGSQLHEPPQIPNFGLPHRGIRLRNGMVLAIEPMVNAGSWKVVVKSDKWTVVTEDGKPSCHFEHTVLVTANGAEILTKT